MHSKLNTNLGGPLLQHLKRQEVMALVQHSQAWGPLCERENSFKSSNGILEDCKSFASADVWNNYWVSSIIWRILASTTLLKLWLWNQCNVLGFLLLSRFWPWNIIEWCEYMRIIMSTSTWCACVCVWVWVGVYCVKRILSSIVKGLEWKLEWKILPLPDLARCASSQVFLALARPPYWITSCRTNKARWCRCVARIESDLRRRRRSSCGRFCERVRQCGYWWQPHQMEGPNWRSKARYIRKVEYGHGRCKVEKTGVTYESYESHVSLSLLLFHCILLLHHHLDQKLIRDCQRRVVLHTEGHHTG